jgi:hypothetical protein
MARIQNEVRDTVIAKLGVVSKKTTKVEQVVHKITNKKK